MTARFKSGCRKRKRSSRRVQGSWGKWSEAAQLQRNSVHAQIISVVSDSLQPYGL